MRSAMFAATSIEDLLSQARLACAQGLKPTVGVLFASVALDPQRLADALGTLAFPVFGCTSCGEILTGPSGAAIHERSAVLALLEMPVGMFQVRVFDNGGRSSVELGREVGQWGRSVFTRPAFVVCLSGLAQDGEQFVRGVCGECAEEVPLFGGLAGDDGQFRRTHVFSNGRASDQGAVVWVLDHERVDLDGMATSGWVGLGSPKTVTEAAGNVVFSIDGEPALDVYKKYLDIKDEDLPGIGVEFPLQVLRGDGTHVLRAVVGVDWERRSLVFAGTVPPGATVRFSSSPGFETIDHARRDFEAFPKGGSPPDVLLMFSCMARHLALGPLLEDEIRAAERLWGRPAIGFFTYGEIGRNPAGRCDFYNETCALALLRIR